MFKNMPKPDKNGAIQDSYVELQGDYAYSQILAKSDGTPAEDLSKFELATDCGARYLLRAIGYGEVDSNYIKTASNYIEVAETGAVGVYKFYSLSGYALTTGNDPCYLVDYALK